MGLQSEFFRGDPKLEACLIQDSAHVTPGAVGDHVVKIQVALTTLDSSDIDDGESTTGTYGPSTAAAVLAFKQKRNIVNPSYQTQADNIVGKMTIAALDREIFQKEQPRTGDVCSLGPEQMQGRNVTRRIS
jgi:peptidoglycan hydrolase-like protein with peptidoglycan-binding domain